MMARSQFGTLTQKANYLIVRTTRTFRVLPPFGSVRAISNLRGLPMVRKLLSSVRWWSAIVALTLAGQSWGLGLGEIDLESALNEKLRAQVELFDADGLESAEILVSLASREDFERVGVERFFFLTDLKFAVSTDRRGTPVITVNSSKPISEPYLNFLVEVLWPSGRLLKEYTLLLDPPTFSQAAAPDVSAPAQEAPESGSAGSIQREPQVSAAPRTSTSTRGTVAQIPNEVDANRTAPRQQAAGMTNRNDTLWTIASANLPSNAVTVQQNMLAIKDLNPKAFIKDNINLLKAGHVLRMPTESEAANIGADEAKRLVAMENQAWRAIARGEAPPTAVADAGEPAELRSPVDATQSTDDKAPQAASADGQLRIVAGDGDSVQGAVDNVAASGDLAAALEEKDRLAREIEELTYQMDRDSELAGNQLSVKDRQLEVKDQQIAEMQAQIEQMRLEMDRLAEERGQNQSSQPQEATAWWQQPAVLYGGVGALVLLSIIGLFAARRRRNQVEDEYYATDEDLAADRMEPAVGMGVGATEDAFADDFTDADLDEELTATQEVGEVNEFAADDDEYEGASFAEDELEFEDDEEGDAEIVSQFEEEYDDDEALDDDDEQTSQTGDVIGEADIYIAYGRYPQAVSLLGGALDEDPDRHDVRHKLLELYVETGDADAFNTHMSTLLERCDDEDVLASARRLEAQLQPEGEPLTGGADDDSDNDNNSTTYGAGAAVLGIVGDAGADEPSSAVDDFELDLEGDSDTHLSGADDTFALDTQPNADNGEFELELDDDLPATESVEDFASSLNDPESPTENLGGAADELGGDLGFDFKDGDTSTDEDSLDDLLNDLDSSSDETASESGDFDLGSLGLDDDDASTEDFDFGDDDADSATTKLDLARAYIDMGDGDGARDILHEVLAEGNDEQQKTAQELLETI